MLSGWIRGIGVLLLVAIASVARADGPGPDLKLLAEETAQSPDHSLSIEQYSGDLGDEWLRLPVLGIRQGPQERLASEWRGGQRSRKLSGRIPLQPGQPIAGAHAEARRRLSNASAVQAGRQPLHARHEETVGRS